MALSDSEFEQVLDQALADIPQDLMDAVENVAIVIEDEPPQDMPPDLLGLYQGIPLTERTAWDVMPLPDKVSIFKGPLTRAFTTDAELRKEIRVTIIHELAHYFGIDDGRLHELGWG